jgi:hypothetical protein
MSQLTDEEIKTMARRRVEAKKGFFVHLSMYVIVNIFLFVIWFITMGPGTFPWFLFVIFGWGIGVVANAVAVFVAPRNSAWEQKEYEKEVERLKKL